MHIGHTKTKRRATLASSTTDSSGSTIVVLSGELDHDGVAAVEGDVRRAAEAATGRLVLDAEDITFVDSAGLRLILQTQMTATERGVDFVLGRPSDNVVRLLELTGLDDVIRTAV